MSVPKQRKPDPDVDEAILKELLAGRRARAMLLHIRHYGGTAQNAWHAIKDLAEIPNYQSPSQAPHVARVERHLAGRHTASSIKWNTAMLCICAACLLLIVRGWSRMSDGIHSYWWPETSANVTKVRYYADSYWAQQRKVVRNYVDYQYEYEIGGTYYSSTIIKQSYAEAFDGPRLKPGSQIRTVFDKENPAKSMYQRDMYQRALPVVAGFVFMLPPLGLLALSAFFELTFRELENCDPLRVANRPTPT